MLKQKIKKPAPRSTRGVATMALVLVLAFFVILPLSLLGFELARYRLMHAQLQAVCDASTLAGTAALASSPPGYTYEQLHNLAMDVAVETFKLNYVLTTPFNETNLGINKNTAMALGPPPLNAANVNITLLDQNGKNVSTDSKDAVIMRVQAIYSDKPIFSSSLLDIGTLLTTTAVSDGGLPQLDLFLCFDVSGSMDDQTKVALVNRFWNPSKGTVDYRTVSSGKSIFDTFGPDNTGSPVNAIPPQNLSYGSYPGSNKKPFVFSEGPYPASNPAADLRGNQFTYTAGSIQLLPNATKYPPGSLVPEQGWPPGNFNPIIPGDAQGNGVNANAYPNLFTDLVVQVPSVGPYDFSKIETCVEASRGNMESDTICLQSQGGSKINPTLPPRLNGYYKAYWSQVDKTIDPLAAARLAANNFFFTMNISSSAHFGLNAFSNAAGTSKTSNWSITDKNCDANWIHSGSSNFRIPLIALDKNKSNYDEVTNSINGDTNSIPLRPTGSTAIAESLHAAILEMTDKAKYRPQAKRAIILFTDGVPSAPGTPSAAEAAAYAEADLAKKYSIPIYTIGLSQNAAIKPLQDKILGDGKANSGKGIAYRSGNNAIYVSVTKSADLNSAFQAIARSLVVLQ